MPISVIGEVSKDRLEDIQWQVTKRPANRNTSMSLPLNHRPTMATGLTFFRSKFESSDCLLTNTIADPSHASSDGSCVSFLPEGHIGIQGIADHT